MRSVRRWAPVAYPVLLVLLTALQAVAPRRDGPLALAQVFAPWLFLPLVALLPQAVLLRDRRLIAALTAAVLAFTVHLGPMFVPSGRSTPDPGATDVRLVSWNVLRSNAPDRVTATLRGLDADVVGLVEVTPRQASAIAYDPGVRAKFGTVLLRPDLARAVLTRHQVVATGIRVDPMGRYGSDLMWARLDTGGGRELTVLVGHPLPARASPSSDLPLRYEAAPRDAELRFTRAVMDEEIAAGRRVVLLGDFNVTDREPAGQELVRGLRDAHAEVGWGAGATWAPPAFRRAGVVLVRIDRILGGPGTVPTASRTDCTWHGSDHCILHATFAIAP